MLVTLTPVSALYGDYAKPVSHSYYEDLVEQAALDYAISHARAETVRRQRQAEERRRYLKVSRMQAALEAARREAVLEAYYRQRQNSLRASGRRINVQAPSWPTPYIAISEEDLIRACRSRAALDRQREQDYVRAAAQPQRQHRAHEARLLASLLPSEQIGGDVARTARPSNAIPLGSRFEDRLCHEPDPDVRATLESLLQTLAPQATLRPKPVDVKGKGKAREEPIPAPAKILIRPAAVARGNATSSTSSTSHSSSYVPLVSSHDASIQRMRSDPDDKVESTVSDLMKTLYGASAVDQKASSNAAQIPAESASSSAGSATASASTSSLDQARPISLQDLLLQRMQRESDSEVRDTVQGLMSKIFGEIVPSVQVATTDSSPSRSGSPTEGVTVESASPNTTSDVTPAADAVAGSSEDTVDAAAAAAASSAASLDIIKDIEASLHTLERNFVLPSRIDFSPAPSPASTPADTPAPNGLTYTPNNSAVHSYEHSLNGLLAQLDAVESHGDADVRGRRREVVKEVERALQDIERRVEESRERESVQGIERTVGNPQGESNEPAEGVSDGHPEMEASSAADSTERIGSLSAPAGSEAKHGRGDLDAAHSSLVADNTSMDVSGDLASSTPSSELAATLPITAPATSHAGLSDVDDATSPSSSTPTLEPPAPEEGRVPSGLAVASPTSALAPVTLSDVLQNTVPDVSEEDAKNAIEEVALAQSGGDVVDIAVSPAPLPESPAPQEDTDSGAREVIHDRKQVEGTDNVQEVADITDVPGVPADQLDALFVSNDTDAPSPITPASTESDAVLLSSPPVKVPELVHSTDIMEVVSAEETDNSSEWSEVEA
ncbi:hypothetical protein WOLCODRAFT_164293 [Wolfiporia cocos MD-104 SS10]|uniref:BAG domain-containing protein n=1 Tax=Wolfiporia cocos (strain MD-104) TaxID=742152 RepID=A0A2H3JMQ7_WOLCO|nr:hypothetical protein WOLCODRAFT_164293 [Wolfiporia cocos MD-104 SS10]